MYSRNGENALSMTPERYRECLHLLRWSMTGLAAILGVNPSTTQNWGRGRGNPIPENAAEWLEARATHAEAFPLPRGWQSGAGGAQVLD